MELEDPDMNSDAKPSKTQEEIIKQFSSSPIDISPIVEKMDNVLIDGDQLQIHTNVFLKQGLKEGQGKRQSISLLLSHKLSFKF